jgi:hypothetical protein
MKNLITLFLITLFFVHEATAQTSIEAQAGGANFMGITINSRFNIPLSRSKEHRLSPSFGLGMLAPGWDQQPTIIINTGLTYNYKAWGIGAEVSGFTSSPFAASNKPRDFVDMIVYPNLNYTLNIKPSFYLRFSAGSYFAFSKKIDPVSEKSKLQFEHDVIPGAGISVGYKFK